MPKASRPRVASSSSKKARKHNAVDRETVSTLMTVRNAPKPTQWMSEKFYHKCNDRCTKERHSCSFGAAGVADCTHSSPQTTNVATHELGAHTDITYPCEICGWDYCWTDPASYSRHLPKMHGDQHVPKPRKPRTARMPELCPRENEFVMVTFADGEFSSTKVRAGSVASDYSPNFGSSSSLGSGPSSGSGSQTSLAWDASQHSSRTSSRDSSPSGSSICETLFDFDAYFDVSPSGSPSLSLPQSFSSVGGTAHKPDLRLQSVLPFPITPVDSGSAPFPLDVTRNTQNNGYLLDALRGYSSQPNLSSPSGYHAPPPALDYHDTDPLVLPGLDGLQYSQPPMPVIPGLFDLSPMGTLIFEDALRQPTLFGNATASAGPKFSNSF